MGLLADIESPEALRKLARPELHTVANELRAELIRVGSEVGGHFAGSLGTVELTVALHYLLDTPRDRVVWDVGHQAYGHKALTGRRAGLMKIKKADGPSGFLRREESEYDAFGAGHAGTSVSAALGMAEAARRSRSGARVVAVIGDGAATSGMSFEGLNHAGHLGTPLCVVFNDNGMSIAPNVGGLSRTGRAREYFESLGLRYLGPVDGHDLDALLPAVEAMLAECGPTVLHVRTKKGAGFAPAEADPFKWHATGPFERSTGASKAASNGAAPSWTSAFADVLIRVAERDPRVVAITAAMPDGTGLDRFAKRFPNAPTTWDRRAARRDLRGRARRRRLPAGVRDLLDVPAARLRPGRARRRAAESARHLRARPRGPGRRRRPDPPRRARPRLSADHSQPGRRRAARRERPRGPARGRRRLRPPVRAALPARDRDRRPDPPEPGARDRTRRAPAAAAPT
jgi:deoxyxylulose-5-phosphate synthase